MLICWACLVWTRCSWNLSIIIRIWLFMESIKWRISVFSPASWPHEHVFDLRKGSDDHKSSVFLKKEEKFRISFGFWTWKNLVRENSLDYGCEYILSFFELFAFFHFSKVNLKTEERNKLKLILKFLIFIAISWQIILHVL